MGTVALYISKVIGIKAVTNKSGNVSLATYHKEYLHFYCVR
jgi:hypothetical protein